MTDVCLALYIQRFKGKTEGIELLRWSDFYEAVTRAGIIGTYQTARAKWFKLSTIPEVFCAQKDRNLVAVDIKTLHSLLYTHIQKTEEVIRW